MPLDPATSFSFSEADEPGGGAVRVALRGELDLMVVEPLGRRLDQLRAQGRSVVLDLAELDFVDSAGIMLFVTASSAAKESGSELLLSSPHGEVERVLRLTGLSELLGFVPPEPGPAPEA